MTKLQILLAILFFSSTKIFGFDLWIAADENEDLPFQIKSDNPDGSGKIYLYSMTGQRLHTIYRIDFYDAIQQVAVLFDNGEYVAYKKIHPKTTKHLVVDSNNQAFVLVKKQVGLSKPKWALYRINTDYPIMFFENVESNESANHFYAFLTTGGVAEYSLAEEHPIPPLLNIPEIDGCLGASLQ